MATSSVWTNCSAVWSWSWCCWFKQFTNNWFSVLPKKIAHSHEWMNEMGWNGKKKMERIQRLERIALSTCGRMDWRTGWTLGKKLGWFSSSAGAGESFRNGAWAYRNLLPNNAETTLMKSNKSICWIETSRIPGGFRVLFYQLRLQDPANQAYFQVSIVFSFFPAKDWRPLEFTKMDESF